MYTPVVTSFPVCPMVSPAISVRVTIPSNSSPFFILLYLSFKFTSAISRASKLNTAQQPIKTEAEGKNPGSADTVGNARIPAPTVEPVTNAIAPNIFPIEAFCLI